MESGTGLSQFACVASVMRRCAAVRGCVRGACGGSGSTGGGMPAIYTTVGRRGEYGRASYGI